MWKDSRILPILQLLAKIYALKQLMIDSTALYETGFFVSGSNELLVESMKTALAQLRP
jgi:hypothetical protein